MLEDNYFKRHKASSQISAMPLKRGTPPPLLTRKLSLREVIYPKPPKPELDCEPLLPRRLSFFSSRNRPGVATSGGSFMYS